ncbi:MarR family winged helix-turn-helix transcriptional regulator [Actinophytocola oryzae]|uniref:DNA-binding MarR family transcriptional regulator n=1 Tax=Actinophytocola oryzae TaxID=502181 RepID=A0A4R7V1M0_9PSEU|nr:MarR family winged helix-turn-helix transcriptional regulator [Actinophytocola oryzae]TDV41735.1 DNA-binding MarR family transcriptional regulator [Actinophytocola oryzae]
MTALDGDLGWTLGVVFRAYVKATNAAVGDLPGGHRGYQILTAATRDQPESQSALCQQLGIDRTVMTYLLDDLEAADLVARRAAPTDRRTRHVVATETGRARLADLDRRLAHAETHVLSGLSKDEQRSLKALLGRLASHVNELDPVADTCTVVEDIAASRS